MRKPTWPERGEVVLVAQYDITCARCGFTVETGDFVGWVFDELCCEDCVYAHEALIVLP
ncbi:hypothetical protein [Kitasatospora sp. NPDC092286]|uniref:hypothetical protein n=1 Tax=Kitasatospora sp. NPDC092286 TaxID=3364087 RepID=UPI0038034A90